LGLRCLEYSRFSKTSANPALTFFRVIMIEGDILAHLIRGAVSWLRHYATSQKVAGSSLG
jgi:hypothetical protein